MVTLQVSPSTFLSAKRPPIHKQLRIPLFLPYPVRAGLLWAFERGVLDRVCGPDVNRLRAELGLPPVRRVMSRWRHSPQGVLGLFPDWFAPPQTDWPARVELTGFPLFDEVEFRNLDPELEDFLRQEDPPVIFTPGSTLVNECAYWRAAVEALDVVGARGVVSRRPGCIALKTEIKYFGAVLCATQPFAALRESVGSSRRHRYSFSGLCCWDSQLITPFAHDQFDNAARVERLGCGFQLHSSGSAQNMRASLKCLLEDESIQQNCAAIRSKVDTGEVSCRKAMTALERIAARARPSIRSESCWQREPGLRSA
jgi:rhamnosyltransferase subunit B